MHLHGIGQSPHDSFLVTSFSTAAPSIFMLVASGKSREPPPFQFMIGASPFSTLSAAAMVVPCSENSRRIALTGGVIFMRRRGSSRYIQPIHFRVRDIQAMKRANRPTLPL